MKIKRIYGGQTLRIAFGITTLAILLLAGSASAATLTVNSSGGADYSRIQDAIDNASAGDMILVYGGTYFETVNVNKQLTLRGIGMPVVSAGSGSAFTLSANGIKLEGFTAESSDYGFTLISSNNALNNNTVKGSVAQVGIFLNNSSNNTLITNTVSSDNGIFLKYSNNNILIGNTAHGGMGAGIGLFSSSNNTLTTNTARTSLTGIYLEDSSNNTLSGNNASSNREYGIYLVGSNNNNKINNNIFNNTNNFLIESSNVAVWNATRQSGTNIIGGSYLGGNFWANPSGTGFSQTCSDRNKDGICDSPFTLDSNNIDYLPLAYWLADPPTQTFNISGYKINSATSSGISGWNITLTNSTMQISMLTGLGGSYKFSNIANGTYNVTEKTRSGFTNVTPTTVQVVIAGRDAININFTNKLITPRQQIQQITTDVQGLVTSGALNKGSGNSLTTKLESATEKLKYRNTNVAINKLQAFIKEVQVYVRARKLTQAQGQELTAAANAVISQLAG